MIKRPPTELERLRARLLMAAHAALWPLKTYRIKAVDGVFCGVRKHICSNSAGSFCYGMSRHYHVSYDTNHEKPIRGEVSLVSEGGE